MSLEQVEALRMALLARREGPPPSLEQRRAGFEAQMAAIALPDDFQAQEVHISPDLPALMCDRPGGRRDQMLVWLHGGAFVLGSASSYRPMAARLAQATGMRVLLPDYRLAPEHPFPAARDDTIAVLAWLDEQGIAMDQVVLGGDSAGANLALAAAQDRATSGKTVPAALWLVSAYLDLTHSGQSVGERSARDPFVDPATMPGTAATYCAGTDPADPRVSPLFGAMAGLPPTLIQVGADEALFSDSDRLRAAIVEAGGCATFQEWAGMIHVWPLFAHIIEEGEWAIAQGGAFVQGALAQAT